MKTDIERLGTAPSFADVDTLLVTYGLNRHVVGKSFLGADLVAYSYSNTEKNTTKTDSSTPTMLFLSLVHGNEPTGLLSLLSVVSKLMALPMNRISPTVVFFPFVNVDAYMLNRNSTGCRRTNLNIDNRCEDQTLKRTCPDIVGNGVDLNRNYPVDWVSLGRQCSFSYPGKFPFSEPETKAVKALVERFRPTHAMSFHSRRHNTSGPRLLIHPYASDRSIMKMDPRRRKNYRKWSKALNRDGSYVTGTAMESIQYTASGSTMDWLETAHSIYAFVAEIIPPSSTRWCHNSTSCWIEAEFHAETAMEWLAIAEHDYRESVESRKYRKQGIGGPARNPGTLLSMAVLVVGVLSLIILRNRRSFLYIVLRNYCRGEKLKETRDTELAAL